MHQIDRTTHVLFVASDAVSPLFSEKRDRRVVTLAAFDASTDLLVTFDALEDPPPESKTVT